MQSDEILNNNNSLNNSQKRKELYINSIISGFLYNKNYKQQSNLITLIMQFNEISNNNIYLKNNQI